MKNSEAVVFALSCLLCCCSIGLTGAFSHFAKIDGGRDSDFKTRLQRSANPIEKSAFLTVSGSSVVEDGSDGSVAAEGERTQVLLILFTSYSFLSCRKKMSGRDGTSFRRIDVDADCLRRSGVVTMMR